MDSIAAGVLPRLPAHIGEIVADLPCTACAVNDQTLSVPEMADVVRVAFSNRNRLDAALTGALGKLDAVTQRAPDDELTGGLSCATWLSQTLHISSSSAYA